MEARGRVDQTLHSPQTWTDNFPQQTALPLSGVLQSSSSVSPLLQVDFPAPSDTPVDVGCRPITWLQEAAVDATGTDGHHLLQLATTYGISDVLH